MAVTYDSNALSLIICGIAAPNFAELPAADDAFQRGVDPVILGFQLGLHVGQERFVRKLHLAAQRVAQQLAAELSAGRLRDGP